MRRKDLETSAFLLFEPVRAPLVTLLRLTAGVLTLRIQPMKKRKRTDEPPSPPGSPAVPVINTAIQQRAEDATQAARLAAAVAATEFMLETQSAELAFAAQGTAAAQFAQNVHWAATLQELGFPPEPQEIPHTFDTVTLFQSVQDNCKALGLPVLAATSQWIVLHLCTCNGLAVLHTLNKPCLTPLFLDVPKLLTNTPS